MQSESVSRIGGHPIATIFLFFALAFLITWGTGMVVVFSTHSQLVNNVQPVAHPIPLAFPRRWTPDAQAFAICFDNFGGGVLVGSGLQRRFSVPHCSP